MLPVEVLNPRDPRPWLLLDVDGVLNIFNGSQNQTLYSRHAITLPNGIFKIKMRRDLKIWLLELTDHFVPVWCTMWNDEANTYLCDLLGMPELPVIPCSYDGTEDPYCHAKVRSIREHVPADRALAWVDDEINQYDEDWGIVRDITTPTKLIWTDERQGLQRHHVDKLIAWSKGVLSDA